MAKPPGSPPGRLTLTGPAGGQPGPDPRAQPSALREAPAPAGQRERKGSPRPSPGWRHRQTPRFFSPLPKLVLPSLPHPWERLDFIKVIFQEIANGSQVAAQSAPERQTQALQFCPLGPPKVERKEQEKSLFGAFERTL